MSDDLVKRLRMKDEYLPLGHDGWEAADRIEQLVAINEALTAMGEQADKDMAFIGDYIIANGNLLAERDALEAKLAKAVEAVRMADTALHEAEAILGGEYGDFYGPLCEDISKLRATLAEIEGEKT